MVWGRWGLPLNSGSNEHLFLLKTCSTDYQVSILKKDYKITQIDILADLKIKLIFTVSFEKTNQFLFCNKEDFSHCLLHFSCIKVVML